MTTLGSGLLLERQRLIDVVASAVSRTRETWGNLRVYRALGLGGVGNGPRLGHVGAPFPLPTVRRHESRCSRHGDL